METRSKEAMTLAGRPLKESIDFTDFEILGPGQTFCDSPEEALDKFRIDLTKEYPPVEYLLKYKGVSCLSQGDLHAIKAKAKQGKSFTCISMAVALLRGEFIGLTAEREAISVLIIDTEQNPLNVAQNVRKVHELCSWDAGADNARFNTYSLRECTHLERRKTLEAAIIRHKPDVVFLDGARDILLDFNAIAESAEAIGFLMRLTKQYHVSLICVLHENKADGNMRGHFGTELLNKCADAYQVKKSGDIITVEQTEARNKPIENWAFGIDADGLPEAVEVAQRISRKDATEMQLRNNIDALFSGRDKYPYSDLISGYMEFSAASLPTAKRHIAEALKIGLIDKAKDGSYTLKNINS